MQLKSLITALLAAIASAVAAQANNILVGKDFGAYAAAGISAATGAAFYHLLTLLTLDIPIQVSWARRLVLDRRAKYEGYYIEGFANNPQRPVSIAQIFYNPEEKSYSYHGRAYDQKGNLKATWKALNIDIDSGNGTAKYFFDANIIGGTTTSVQGHGNIDFSNGTGTFVDSGSESALAEWAHSIRKLTPQDLETLIGTTKMPPFEDRGQIAVAYLQARNGKPLL